MKKVTAWIKRRWLLVLGLAFVAFNLVAFSQAWKMSHFVPGGVRTQAPEKLSLFSKIAVLFTGVTIPRPLSAEDPSKVGLNFKVVNFAGGSTASLEAWEIVHKKSVDWVVLFPGYAGAKGQLVPEAKEFYDLGFNVLLVDLPGSGGSTGDRTSIGYYEGADVAEACKYARAKAGHGKVILYGLSMGAASILRAVAEYGARPFSIILECPFDSLLDTAINRFHIMGLPGFPGAHAIVFWASVQQGTNFFAYRLSKEAVRVQCPTLLMAGAHDTRATLPEAKAVFDALTGPKEWVLFEQAGHQQYLLADKAKWLQAVKKAVSPSQKDVQK